MLAFPFSRGPQGVAPHQCGRRVPSISLCAAPLVGAALLLTTPQLLAQVVLPSPAEAPAAPGESPPTPPAKTPAATPGETPPPADPDASPPPEASDSIPLRQPTKPAAAQPPSDPEQSPSEPASEPAPQPLKARLRSSPTSENADGQPTSRVAPPPALRPELAYPEAQPATRQEEMPGDYVARPITLPRGTFSLAFGQGIVAFHAEPFTALAPAFGFGVTEFFEIGVDAPLRYDAGIDEWTALNPRPHLAVTWIDQDEVEVGTRLRAVIPARPLIEPSGSVAFPILWRTSPITRLDFVPEFEVGLGDPGPLVVRVPVAGAIQMSPGSFAGLQATANVGLADPKDTGLDLELMLGLTFQGRGQAYVDFITRLFMTSIAGGDHGEFSNGGGTTLSLIFYPELY